MNHPICFCFFMWYLLTVYPCCMNFVPIHEISATVLVFSCHSLFDFVSPAESSSFHPANDYNSGTSTLGARVCFGSGLFNLPCHVVVFDGIAACAHLRVVANSSLASHCTRVRLTRRLIGSQNQASVIATSSPIIECVEESGQRQVLVGAPFELFEKWFETKSTHTERTKFQRSTDYFTNAWKYTMTNGTVLKERN